MGSILRTSGLLSALVDIRFYRLLWQDFHAYARRTLARYRTDIAGGRPEDADPVSRETKARWADRTDILFRGIDHVRLGRNVLLNSDVEIIAGDPDPAAEQCTRVQVGDDTYLGRRVELQAAAGQLLVVGDQASINHNCVIIGDVSIGRYSLLSCNIYISTGNHHAELFPSWTIRDQDDWSLANPEPGQARRSAVTIEEDCWIGWGVFIKRGVYIGRGAVIGAYTVVTRDVPPYSVQLGAPNRELRKRVEFSPPAALSALDDAHLPYFYAGFLVRQRELAASRELGIVRAKSKCRVVLSGGPFTGLRVAGVRTISGGPAELQVYCNGLDCGRIALDDARFDITLDLAEQGTLSPSDGCVPNVMQAFNTVEFRLVSSSHAASEHHGSDRDVVYGLSTVELLRS